MNAKSPFTFQRMLDSNLVFREKAPKASTLGLRFYVYRVCNIFEKSIDVLLTNSQNECIRCPLGEFSVLFG